MIRLRRLVFLISWKTVGKQMVVYHSKLTILRWSRGTNATCPVFLKKQAIICLEVLSARATFVGFGSSRNTRTVDCCLLRVQTRKSTIHHLSLYYRRVSKHRDRIFKAFLSTNRNETFFGAIDKFCGIQREQIFLTIKCSCNIECMLVQLMPKVASISR